MHEPLSQPPRMTAEEYLEWHQRQDERYELVDGVPRLKFVTWDGPRMMVGATQAHIRLNFKVARELDRLLQGRSCRVMPSDGKVVTPRGNYRFPDVAVDCGPYHPASSVLSEPVAVVEVWSKSTHWIDTTRKLEDYKSIASIAAILFLSQDLPRGQLWSREGQAWSLEELEGLEAEARLPGLGVSLPFAVLYEGMELG